MNDSILENIEIRKDDLKSSEVIDLIKEHREAMMSITPEDCVYALKLEGLRNDQITFWTIWVSGQLTGCGALKDMGGLRGEIKSMRIKSSFLRQGLADKMLKHILDQAKERGYRYLYLETGTSSEFIPAYNLYKKHGFSECEAFGDYREDPSSCFMKISIIEE